MCTPRNPRHSSHRFTTSLQLQHRELIGSLKASRSLTQHYRTIQMRFRTLLAVPLLIPAVSLAQQQNRPIINGGLPSVSPHGDAIAFISNRDGTYDVYVTSVDGAELMRITNTPASESAPLWTSGARVVFATWADNKSTVYAASSDSPQPTVIGTTNGRQPAISPDGKKLLYSKGQFPSMLLAESVVDGSGERELSRTPSAQFNAVYSPDQKQIAFARADSTRQLQIWVMNADGTESGSSRTSRRRMGVRSGQPGRPTARAWQFSRGSTIGRIRPKTRPTSGSSM